MSFALVLPKTWIVYGGKEWIGGQFVEYLKSIGHIVHDPDTSLIDTDGIENDFTMYNCDHVICAIDSYNNDDLVESIDNNFYGPLNLALMCQRHKIHMTYVGTATTTSMSGKFSLLQCINALLNQFDCVLTLLLYKVIGDHPHQNNYITKMIHCDRIIGSTTNYVSVIHSLLPLAITIAANKEIGTIHLANPTTISTANILTMYKEIVDNHFTWLESDSIDHEQNNTIICTNRLESLVSKYNIHGLQCASIAVRDALQQYYLKDPWIPQNILVTGGCGFIGSHLVQRLLQTDYVNHVVTVDKISYCSFADPFMIMTKSEQELYKNRHSLEVADILDRDRILEIIDSYKIDTILHLAAETHVDRSFESSLRFTETNVVGTHNMLQCCLDRRTQIKRFIHVSTDEVYGGNDIDVGFTEKSLLNPTNPYAASKVAAEALVKSYQHSFGIPCIITRGNNVYGSCHFPDKLIPKFICLLKAHKSLPVHGSGSSKRSFLHVTDTANAMEIIMRWGSVGDIYNIAGDHEYSVLDVVQYLREIASGMTITTEGAPDRAFNDQRYFIDSTKLRRLGWEPKVSFNDGLRDTFKWFMDHDIADFWNIKEVEIGLQAHPEHNKA